MVSKINNKRKAKNAFLSTITYFSSFFVLIIVVSIFVFSCVNGVSGLSWKMFVSDYYEEAFFAKVELVEREYTYQKNDNEYFSKTWGVAFKDDVDLENNPCVTVSYIDPSSPFSTAKDVNSEGKIEIKNGQLIKRIQVKIDSVNTVLTSNMKAEKMISEIDRGKEITEFYFASMGGGIRGSLLTTLYLILLSLLFSLPLGVFVAIYLANYAKKGRVTRVLSSMIDMLSGIPSIIFGLVGSIIFIPFVSAVSSSNGPSIVAGALTLAIMLLPTIIKNTEDAINVIPKSYKQASLALGASETQTTLRIILPNAVPGILTAVLLSIGRIIGESAALIFVMGSAIQDQIDIFKGSTSLAVHIWSVVSGENPKFNQACAISIIILMMALLLNLLVKLVCKRLSRFEVKQ